METDNESNYSADPLKTSSDALQYLDNRAHDRLTLTWEGLSVHAPPPRKPLLRRKKYSPLPEEQKPVLHCSSGIVHPGNILAVIGASGSGKTVLLNCMTRRNLGNLEVRGEVRVNGHSLGSAISKVSAYVQQQDAFIGTLKVREHLWFQSQLRLDSHLTNEERNQRVEEVMTELGLSQRAETLIGTPGRLKTLSGGERRRLLFASEILTKPLLLFCDEPTTGLDAFMAQSVIQMLRGMAAKGRTIVCTIHQPASEVYAMFDQLALLADGHMAFMGSTQDVLSFFSNVGHQCPLNYNPADFFVRTLALIPGKEEEHFATVRKISVGYERSIYFEDIIEEIKSCRKQHQYDEDFFKTLSKDSTRGNMDTRGYHRSKWVQLQYLCWRAWLQQVRDPVAFKSALMQMLIVGVFVGLIYLQQNYDQKGIQNINGALFMMQMMVTFTTMFSVLSILPGEYPLFRREYQDRMYGVDTYYLSHLITELPMYVMLLPTLFLAVTYWFIGLNPSWMSFLNSNAAMFVISLYGLGIAHLVSVLTCSVTMSLSILPLIRNILTIFGGYFINVVSVPWILRPMEYLSAFVYSNEIMVVNQWKGISEIVCEYQHDNATADSARCLANGAQVISSLNFSPQNVTNDYIYLTVIYLAAEFLGIFVLYMRARKLRLN